MCYVLLVRPVPYTHLVSLCDWCSVSVWKVLPVIFLSMRSLYLSSYRCAPHLLSAGPLYERLKSVSCIVDIMWALCENHSSVCGGLCILWRPPPRRAVLLAHHASHTVMCVRPCVLSIRDYSSMRTYAGCQSTLYYATPHYSNHGRRCTTKYTSGPGIYVMPLMQGVLKCLAPILYALRYLCIPTCL